MSFDVIRTGGEWHGYRWQPVEFSGRITLWRPATFDLESDYQDTLTTLSEVVPAFVTALHSSVSWADTEIDVALFPWATFLDRVELDAEAQAWVTACVRDGILCCRRGFLPHADPAEYTQSKRIGVIHELMHVVFARLTARADPFPTTVDEGLAEAVPRFLIGMQREDSESRAFLAGLTESDLLTAREIDEEGVFARSLEPPGRNVSYASALFLVVGAAQQLSGDLASGFEQLVDLGAAAGADGYYAALAETLRMPAQDVVTGTVLQRRGQDYLARFEQ